MKKGFFILAVILMINQNVFSQEEDRKVTIQVNPLLWFVDVFTGDSGDMLLAMDLEGQFKITNSVNFSVTVSFLISDYTLMEDYDYDYDYYSSSSKNVYYKEKIYQVNLKPMFIYRPFETGLKGFYLGFYPNVGLLHVETNNVNQFYTELGFGMNIGYKWIFKGGFTMQVGGGVGKTFSIPEGGRQYLSINSDLSFPMLHTDLQLLGFKIGYSF